MVRGHGARCPGTGAVTDVTARSSLILIEKPKCVGPHAVEQIDTVFDSPGRV